MAGRDVNNFVEIPNEPFAALKRDWRSALNRCSLDLVEIPNEPFAACYHQGGAIPIWSGKVALWATSQPRRGFASEPGGSPPGVCQGRTSSTNRPRSPLLLAPQPKSAVRGIETGSSGSVNPANPCSRRNPKSAVRGIETIIATFHSRRTSPKPRHQPGRE